MEIINLEDWLLEAATGTDTQTGSPLGSPTSQPNVGAMSPSTAPKGDPNIANMPPAGNEKNDDQEELPDYANDPQNPDMPEEEQEELNFEQWKKKYIVTSTKGAVDELKDMIMQICDRDLDSYQRRFVEDNLQILFLREHSNIDKASKEIRKLIKQDLDHNNPSTSLVSHIISVLNTVPLLNSVFIKLTGLRGMKGELHREFIAALTGSVQVSGAGRNADLILSEKGYSIRISTRFNSEFGNLPIGPWELKTDDAERYLQPPELRRLEEGSPEERSALTHRVIIESIAEFFRERSFVINVVGSDLTIYMIGWDVSTSLKSAFNEGRLIIKTVSSDNLSCFIDEDGSIIEIPEIKILYVKNGDLGEDGKVKKEEYEFIEKKNVQLFLSGTLQTIKEASTSFQGLLFKEIPFTGNRSDGRTLSRCHPDTSEMIMRNC